MKSVILFIVMLAVFAAGLYVVGFSEGSATWIEVAVVTVAFGVWQIWKRVLRSKRREKPGAA